MQITMPSASICIALTRPLYRAVQLPSHAELQWIAAEQRCERSNLPWFLSMDIRDAR